MELNEVLGFILDRWPEKIKPRDNYLVETQAEILKNLTQLESLTITIDPKRQVK